MLFFNLKILEVIVLLTNILYPPQISSHCYACYKDLVNIDWKTFFSSFQEWQCVQSKGCFFLEEDGEIISHQYRMQIAQRSMVYVTIKPLNLSQVEGKL